MKIAFTGSHGTGKTTLAKKISEDLNLELITNISRNYYQSKGIQDFEVLTKEERWIHQKNLFTLEIIEESKYTNFVTDRSVIDFLAYTILYSKSSLVYMTRLIELTKKVTLKYDYLFLLPIEFSYQPEIGRASRETQIEVDECIKFLIDTLKLPHFILKGTIEERLRLIKQIIDK